MTTQAERIGWFLPAGVPVWRRIAESWASAATVGSLTVMFPDGSSRVYAAGRRGPDATIEVHRGRAVWRTLLGGELGFAEAYIDGDWSSPDVATLVEYTFANQDELDGAMRGSWLRRTLASMRHRLRANTRAGSRRNIAEHYDLGNDFYREWLDETMTYSSAMFASPELSLADAQRMKYRRIMSALDLKPGDRVLEIGCGWGGFAELAAVEAGVSVTAITLSQEQARYARRRIIDAGLQDRVEIRVEDYRDVAGTYDRVVSIEMLEAVGERHWPRFFGVVADRLKDGGSALIQTITISDDRFETYRKSVDFIQRYIFPGGMLPSPGAMNRAVNAAGLQMTHAHFFGASYAETLKLWGDRFEERWEHIAQYRFDDRFRRMWAYYLNSCEACFRCGATDVGQFLIEAPARGHKA